MQTRIDRPHQTAIRFLLFRIPTIKHPERCMFSVLRWGNIIGDRAAPELTAKHCCPFQEVGRNLCKRAVIFYELYAVSPQVLDEVLTRHCPVPRWFPHPRSFQGWSCGYRSCGHSGNPGSSNSDLRHSCASLLLANDIPMKAIQEWLGHATFNITANLYSHLEYHAKVTSAETIARVLSGKKEDAPTDTKDTAPEEAPKKSNSRKKKKDTSANKSQTADV